MQLLQNFLPILFRKQILSISACSVINSVASNNTIGFNGPSNNDTLIAFHQALGNITSLSGFPSPNSAAQKLFTDFTASCDNNLADVLP